MAYRIDVNARYRFAEDGERATPIPPAQGETFRRDIERASRDGSGNGNNKPDLEQRPFVVEAGDTLEDIARENHTDLAETMALNANDANHNGDLIHPGDIVLLPEPDPELVAASEPNQAGEPAGEDAFVDGIQERGNRIEFAKPEDGIDAAAETKAIQEDVEAYLDALPPEARQDAALRLLEQDWVDSGPAGIAVADAVEGAGLQGDPVEAFADELYQDGNALEYAEPGAAIDRSGEARDLAADVETFLQTLPEADRADALQNLYDRNWTDAGPAQIAIEQAAGATGLALKPTGHNEPAVESQVRAIVDEAKASGSEETQFAAFAEAYAAASPEVQAALLKPGYADDFMTSMAAYATQPLADYDPATDMQAEPYETFLRLETMTQGAEPELAAELVSAAMPEIERANALYQEQTGFSMLGIGGVESMLKISERIEGTPAGEQVIEDWAQMGFYAQNELTQSIGDGGSLTYALELSQQAGASTHLLENDILPGVRENQSSTNAAVDAYSAHMEELRWLIDNHGATMTPDQLQEAIADYKAEKGDAWVAEEQRLESEVVAQGEELLNQISQLGNMPQEPAEQKALVNGEIETILNDDKSYLAIQTALRTNPDLLDNPATLDFLGETGRLTDRGRKLAEEVVTQLVKRNVLPKFEDFIPESEVGRVAIRDSLAEFRDGRIAKLIGVTEGDMNKAINAIEKSLPAAGDTQDMIIDKMAKLDQDLGKLDSSQPSGVRSFSSSTVPGQLLRMIGAAGSAAGLYNSARAAGQEPNVETILKTTFDGVGLWQRSVEIRAGLGMMDGESFAVNNFGSSVKTPVKILGVIGAGFDAVNSAQAFAEGDPLMGGIHAVTAAGGATAAIGTGTVFGPIGLGVVILGVGASMVVSDVRESNKYDNETSERFLAHSGLSPEASEALVDQSGEGHSPVPLLLEYAGAKGFDMNNAEHRTAFVDWLNTMSPDQLATLRDNLHHTIDDLRGDATKLEQTAADDADYTNPTLYNQEIVTPRYSSFGERFDVQAGGASPSSVTQIDVALTTLGIPELALPVG